MKTEIFIVTFARDSEWLEYCIRSIHKFARGFSGVTVAAPTRDESSFSSMCPRWGARLVTFEEAPPPLGHLHHNAMKCRADLLCPEADFICHLDSDCVFSEPTSPEAYFVGQKPVLLIEQYSRILKTYPDFPWQRGVEVALGRPVVWETMRRHPMVNYLGVYADVRSAVERATGKEFVEYVLSCHPHWPYGFAEFNTIGAVILDSPWKEKYHLVDLGQHPYPHNPVVQFWSHSSTSQPQDIYIDGILRRVVPIDMINELLK